MSGTSLTVEAAREAAKEAMAVFEANAERMTKVQDECAGDMGKFMMLMIPLATELLSSVITKHGFPGDSQGAMAFQAELQKHAGDAEIKVLADNLKARFMPKMPASPAPPADEGVD
jgi:hypothetical protein